MATILIVDDSPVSRRLLAYALRPTGHHLITAADAQEALSCMEHTCPDLIIADLAMPRMSGVALFQHVRAAERLRAIPLVMLTASGQEQHRREAQAAGADGFLTKPASSRELLSVVERWLGRRLPAEGAR